MEQKYLEVQKEEEVNAQRRGAVMGFLSAREKMLNRMVGTTLKGDNETPQEESEKPQAKEEKTEGDNHAVSFDNSETSPSEVSPATSKALVQLSCNNDILDCLQDKDGFQFETSLVRPSWLLCV
jgi:hypothetical protein